MPTNSKQQVVLVRQQGAAFSLNCGTESKIRLESLAALEIEGLNRRDLQAPWLL